MAPRKAAGALLGVAGCLNAAGVAVAVAAANKGRRTPTPAGPAPRSPAVLWLAALLPAASALPAAGGRKETLAILGTTSSSSSLATSMGELSGAGVSSFTCSSSRESISEMRTPLAGSGACVAMRGAPVLADAVVTVTDIVDVVGALADVAMPAEECTDVVIHTAVDAKPAAPRSAARFGSAKIEAIGPVGPATVLHL